MMLKKIRVIVSLMLVSLITLYFLDFRGFLPQRFSFPAEIQFIPAVLALNVGIIVALVMLTLIFGRIYCSSVCPMGIYQDVVAWLSKKFTKKKRYTYSKAKTVLRWSVLAARNYFSFRLYLPTWLTRPLRSLRENGYPPLSSGLSGRE